MPTLWFLQDGRASYAEAGPGVTLDFEEAAAVFGTEDLRYIGPHAPNFGVDREPGPDRNVVLEVGSGEGSSVLLPDAGFYWATSISEDMVHERLGRARSH